MNTQPFPRTRNLDLRRARQSMRLSQAQFAEAVRATGNAVGAPNKCTKRLVQKWETGEHSTCQTPYLAVLQALTGLPASELGFRLLPDPPAEPTTGSQRPQAAEVREPSGGDGALSAAEFAAPGMAEHYAATTSRDSLERLRHALNHPSTADSRTAEFVETATARLFDLEHHSPARLIAQTVERHMAMVTALLTAARAEKVRRSLTISAGHTALLAGWLAFDRGDSPSAYELWADAISAAQCTADDGLFAATLTCQSYAVARRGDPGAAWQLAHTAASRTLEDPRAKAWTTTRVALYAAQAGDHQAAQLAMQHSLEMARRLPSSRPGDHALPWTRSFDQAALLASTAHTAALLNDPSALDYATRTVDALGPAKVKSRAVALAQATLAAAIVGEMKLCLEYGSAAATLTLQLDVSIAADLLHDVVATILPYSDIRPIRGLLAQLNALPRHGTNS